MCHLQNSKAIVVEAHVVAMEAYFVEGAANSKHVYLFFSTHPYFGSCNLGQSRFEMKSKQNESK